MDGVERIYDDELFTCRITVTRPIYSLVFWREAGALSISAGTILRQVFFRDCDLRAHPPLAMGRKLAFSMSLGDTGIGMGLGMTVNFIAPANSGSSQ